MGFVVAVASCLMTVDRAQTITASAACGIQWRPCPLALLRCWSARRRRSAIHPSEPFSRGPRPSVPAPVGRIHRRARV